MSPHLVHTRVLEASVWTDEIYKQIAVWAWEVGVWLDLPGRNSSLSVHQPSILSPTSPHY